MSFEQATHDFEQLLHIAEKSHDATSELLASGLVALAAAIQRKLSTLEHQLGQLEAKIKPPH